MRSEKLNEKLKAKSSNSKVERLKFFTIKGQTLKRKVLLNPM